VVRERSTRRRTRRVVKGMIHREEQIDDEAA
jgi:hypothetical protein